MNILPMFVPIILALAGGFLLGWIIKTSLDRAKLTSSLNANIKLQAELTHVERRVVEERQQLEKIKTSMETSFKAMAADIANRNTSTFLEQAKEQFRALQTDSEKDLETKKKLIDKSLTSMNAKLDAVSEQSIRLKASVEDSRTAVNLLRKNTEDLKIILSSSQQRGQWGERMVQDILQLIGLQKGINYTTQETMDTSGQRPDFTFLLPKNKKLNMDVKFPLAHYKKYLFTEDEATRNAEKNQFLQDVRKHIQSVAGRGYISEDTLDYVLVFIPNESIYSFINQEDPQMTDHGLQNHILLCSPMMLYAVLSLIHQAARSFTMNKRASEIMDLVAEFKKQWGNYVQQMDKLGANIKRLDGNFQALVTTRSKKLERPLDKIEMLSDDMPDDSVPTTNRDGVLSEP